MTIVEYLNIIGKRYKSGISREHSYRGDLESLIRELVKGVEITNEPANVTDCGNPDYVITKGKIPIGYIEAKDIGKDLKGKQYKEQFTRYKKALDNLIITDYIWFQFFQNGELIHEIKIGEIEQNSIKPITDNFEKFENLIQNFCTFIGQTIKSSKKLAVMMAAKARLLEDILEKAITSDEETQENTSLKEQYDTFKLLLIHDLKPKEFSDIYAQTLAYGMFAARLNDKTLDDFSRQEAAELIPKSNPFLRKLFGYVAGPDIDERIKRTVDNLADVFRATNIEELLKNFGKSTQTNDPIIHFYETFLAEYDPKLRKSRGVWYTPEPVVNFIVRAVDDILKSEFNLPQGLADTSKTKIKLPDRTKNRMGEKEVHKVQILDPATGTGTFLAEVVKHIYKNNFASMQGAWSGYVEEHLIPRLNGFELLMASYSMAHLKMDMLLKDTGYEAKKDQRFNIYLTNSLEEYHPYTGTLFASWLSTEASKANYIKRDTPVMCVIGNPPYSVSSSNKSEWIKKIMIDFKKDLNERNIQPLSDDYIKFIRFGQYYIDKNGEGILAYISNNSFIDGIIHRQMRKNLLETFDKIYILDLHGNAKKKETAPDGGVDQNVFDIMQGVSINIFVKKTRSKKLAKIYHYDLYGKREEKYSYLFNNSINSINWNKLENQKPHYYFAWKDFGAKELYNKGFSIKQLFINSNVGFTSARDNSLVNFDEEKIHTLLDDMTNLKTEELRNKYSFGQDSRDWTVLKAITDIKTKVDRNVTKINYRPFDLRFTHYSNKTKGFLSYPRWDIMQHFFKNNNIGLIATRVNRQKSYGYFWITNTLLERHILDSAGDSTSVFPLYLYPENINNVLFTENNREPNLNLGILRQISNKLGLKFTNEKEEAEGTFAPIDILDYIYAVLHSPTYREKYKEFLKIDFPRVPYPKDKETFWKLVKLGGTIRQIHLLESPIVNKSITRYPQNGDNIITRKLNKNDWEINPTQTEEYGTVGKIWLNDQQYFENIPLIAWEFYIGGYQPAQKWLKDRKGRQLSFNDIQHYQKIIVALYETDRLMKQINGIEIE